MSDVFIRRHLNRHTGTPCGDRRSVESRVDRRGVREAPSVPIWWETGSSEEKRVSWERWVFVGRGSESLAVPLRQLPARARLLPWRGARNPR